MRYELLYMRPADEFDSIVAIQATPNWLERICGRKPRTLKYYGSGTTWRKAKDGPRCDGLTSEWLHALWNRELNRRLEASNCVRSRAAW